MALQSFLMDQLYKLRYEGFRRLAIFPSGFILTYIQKRQKKEFERFEMNSCINEFASKGHKIYIMTTLPKYDAYQMSRCMGSVGRCERIMIKDRSDLKSLSSYYLVWYTINDEGLDGYDKTNSYNYSLHDITQDYLNGRLITTSYKIRIEQLEECMRQFEMGLTKPIDIRVVCDTTINKSLVVDGTKRLISLYYFMLQKPKLLDRLLSSDHSIYILNYSSDVCHEFFPYDFHKLF